MRRSALWLAILGVSGVRHGEAQSAPIDSVPPHQTFTIESKAVGELRRLNVYLPARYRTDPAETFPVLYLPDGGIEEDFPHVVNTLDSLIRRGEVRPFIVVGIENTERRRDMTGPTTVASDSAIAPRVGGAAAFRAFLRDELTPVIVQRYRTSGETAIAGESLVGLFIMETLFTEPAMFDTYIALSPSVWWNDDELVRTAGERLGALTGLHRTLFLSAANEANIAPGTTTIARIITGQRPDGLTLIYLPMPNEEHSTIYRAAAPLAFKRLFGVGGRQ